MIVSTGERLCGGEYEAFKLLLGPNWKAMFIDRPVHLVNDGVFLNEKGAILADQTAFWRIMTQLRCTAYLSRQQYQYEDGKVDIVLPELIQKT